SHRRRTTISALIGARVTGRGPDEMAEPILRAVAEADTPADGPRSQDDARRRRFRGEFKSPIFLAAVAILGIAFAVSLFAASFVLLTHPTLVVRPAPPSLVRGLRTAVPPRTVPPPAPTAEPLPATARFALAQGNANFNAGAVSVARFYYEQAFDGGDA